jgi:hypothetical protein
MLVQNVVHHITFTIKLQLGTQTILERKGHIFVSARQQAFLDVTAIF